MKKINLLSKTIILLLVALILFFTLSLKNESIFHTRKHEINLRYLNELNTREIVEIVISICFSTCFVSFFSLLLPVELFKVCCRCLECGNWENRDIFPNKNTFFYFILNGLLILNVVCFFYGNVAQIEFLLIGVSGINVIWTIIYFVRCCKNPKSYCTDICSGEFIKGLAIYPSFYFADFFNRACCCYFDGTCTICTVAFFFFGSF